MDNIVYGKTEGIKKRVLEQLQSLYDLHLDQGQLISEELALLLRDISESIGREVSVYVDRKGIISSVSVYSRNPLISLIRDKIVLQLQLITPGSVSMTVCRKCSISSLDEATACTCSLSLPVTR